MWGKYRNLPEGPRKLIKNHPYVYPISWQRLEPGPLGYETGTISHEKRQLVSWVLFSRSVCSPAHLLTAAWKCWMEVWQNCGYGKKSHGWWKCRYWKLPTLCLLSYSPLASFGLHHYAQTRIPGADYHVVITTYICVNRTSRRIKVQTGTYAWWRIVMAWGRSGWGCPWYFFRWP